MQDTDNVALAQYIQTEYQSEDGQKTLLSDFVRDFHESLRNSWAWPRKRIREELRKLGHITGRSTGSVVYIGNLVRKDFPRVQKRYVLRDVRLLLETVVPVVPTT
jgi:hypothetical protein